ncbi:esterase/lipase family protein [Bifidobacterium simiarum]|uniref:esterase/lipase family protein n=1 Tax=Bifidobacterium simiarum TaxID=2045441 RepID=UPI001BDD150B|nr:alpha/beta hydrolase [Bifidobacterium simiarum]MBT1165867.1 alpha/beta hydrolase [Bifidobacterium simiarum]
MSGPAMSASGSGQAPAQAHVQSRIYGGGTPTTVDLDRFSAAASTLNGAATALSRLSAEWRAATIRLQQLKTRAPFCPRLGGTPLSPTAGVGLASAGLTGAGPFAATVVHVSLDYPRVSAQIIARADEADRLAERLTSLADQIIRAYSLYSQAEHAAARILGETLQTVAVAKPEWAAAGLALLASGSVVAGSAKEGRFNPIYAITGTWWAQEGLLAGLGARMTGKTGRMGILKGVLATDEVNDAAGRISGVSAPANNLLFGDRLEVREIHPAKGIGGTATIADTLTNVHDMRLNKVDYGSIAIQQYRREDGKTAWMVTVPGTDGHLDSPFSWQTNVELMSSDARQRMAADSARMVDEAMRQAGIRPNDPVAIVGHSQGGIVAAVIASDRKQRYNVQHIVTAGSPVANHPVGGTWVTSVEMNDELVSNLDGSRNPVSPGWLTVRGTSQPMGSAAGTAVENTDGRKFITHDMNYMKAAWKDAQSLGSPALKSHEEHFGRTINGTLVSTRYYRGRISRTGPDSPP